MTATRTPDRPAEAFPSLPLDPVRHQQVRALLVREAAAPRRPTAVRWAVPVGVGAVAAAVAAAVALGGSQLLGADGRGDPAVVEDRVDCGLGTLQGDLTDVPDDWRLLSTDPAPMAVEATWVTLTPTSCQALPTARARQVLVAAQPDGTVTAALTAWTSAPPPGVPGEDSAVQGWEPVQVRGTTGAVRTDGTRFGTEQVWWTEDGEQRSVSVAGLDRATLLALVERLGPDGTLPAGAVPAGMTPLDWAEPPVPQTYEPTWLATYGLPGSREADGGGAAADVSVARTTDPWQAWLSLGLGGPTPSRLVDVDGHPGVLFDNGTGRLWLQYSLGDGVQVTVQSGPGADDATASLDFARTFVPVPADDPRLVEPDWATTPTGGP